MDQPLRFSQLSTSRQALVRLCQDINFGQILGLQVRNAEPIWDPPPTILSEIKLESEEAPRLALDLADFKLSSAIRRLMRQLDQIQEGRIEKIEIREGIPRRLMISGLVNSTALPAGPRLADPV
jgi:hypothetical protein